MTREKKGVLAKTGIAAFCRLPLSLSLSDLLRLLLWNWYSEKQTRRSCSKQRDITDHCAKSKRVCCVKRSLRVDKDTDSGISVDVEQIKLEQKARPFVSLHVPSCGVK